MVVFAGLYFNFLGPIGEFFAWLKLQMNAGFYYSVFGLFTVIYLLVFLKTRFDYWEFRHNEVIHRRGVFADIKRYSTEDLRWFKEIPDVLERILAGGGRMILTTPARAAPDRDRDGAGHQHHRRAGRRHPRRQARHRRVGASVTG